MDADRFNPLQALALDFGAPVQGEPAGIGADLGGDAEHPAVADALAGKSARWPSGPVF